LEAEAELSVGEHPRKGRCLMCPLCIGTAAWLVSSGTSAGGITALVLRRRSRLESRKTRGSHGSSELAGGSQGNRGLARGSRGNSELAGGPSTIG
jgi:hypothetical protein